MESGIITTNLCTPITALLKERGLFDIIVNNVGNFLPMIVTVSRYSFIEERTMDGQMDDHNYNDNHGNRSYPYS